MKNVWIVTQIFFQPFSVRLRQFSLSPNIIFPLDSVTECIYFILTYATASTFTTIIATAPTMTPPITVSAATAISASFTNSIPVSASVSVPVPIPVS